MADTATAALPAPPMAQPPKGAEGMTEVAFLVGFGLVDHVQTWSLETVEWLDGLNGANFYPGCNVLVWWRWTPTDPVDEAAHWIESVCKATTGQVRPIGLDPSVIAHGRELATALRERAS